MHGQSEAKTHDEYIAALDEPRRSEIRALHELVLRTVPELEPTMMGGALGYGPFHYKYASGREGDATLVGIANNKQYISLYVIAANEDEGYIAGSYQSKLPKASIGKGCVRIKRLSDVDLDVVADLLRHAAQVGPAVRGGKAT
ncbi:DUF1801 domain-containing protein [Tenggerimyces flavus]|uniref:DUF1801 domain-containing protein n=1 Tax=Tenggerimyces flavus TaxID=1708749 RepID=A0ABV7Y7M2_9ACTN|nr:DUF1801 domain-containing protein [Tenggerimyces flavus]MBM7785701.1 hypothetical protein [Tenggerimyces flavus]